MMFAELAERAAAVRELYAAFEQRNYGSAWTNEELALGFVGDVGDLAKLVVAQEGHRAVPDAAAKLRHELADCLWSLLVIARAYDIDLEQSFLQTMDELEHHLTGHE